MNKHLTRLAYRSLILVGLLTATSARLLGCSKPNDGGDSQTNWLRRCAQDSECGGLSCQCGYCMKSCTVAQDCSGLPAAAACQSATSSAVWTVCGGQAGASAICLAACDPAASCPSGQSCVAGACVPRPVTALDAGALADGADTEAAAAAPGLVTGDLCPRLLQAFCDYEERCGCNAAELTSCRDFAATNCLEPTSSWTNFDRAVAAGDLVYHPGLLDAALAPLASPTAPCYAHFADLGWDSVTAYDYGGVLTGTHALSDTCTLPAGFKGGVQDCQDGSICWSVNGGQARCVLRVGLGEACDLGDNPSRVCIDRRPPDSDDEFESAFESLMCIPATVGATTGTCSKNLDDGEACQQDETCKSGRCLSTAPGTATCQPKLGSGQACLDSGECVSGACRLGDGGTGLCSDTLLGDGESCGYDNASCASGSCHAPDNQTSGKSPGVCGPKITGAVGEACAQGYECASGVCRSNQCWAHICG